ncbi:MAG: transglycosylase SLT domain-containing protein [Prevotellaceae bacterium]|nr:transglycosylase SLT domain-containing protein [Prevotellaceae bacterium]
MAVILFVSGFVVKFTDSDVAVYPKNTLVVALDTCRFNYFLHHAFPEGYQFDLLRLFAEHENVDIDFHVLPDSLKYEGLKTGWLDIAVCDNCLLADIGGQSFCSSLPLDDSLQTRWLTHGNMRLMRSINIWAEKFRQQGQYMRLHNKYFGGKYSIPRRLSPYDSLLKIHSAKIGWDWRLVASIVYHESKFKPLVVSPNGAQGLMQLMPVTAAYFGVHNIFDPEENIRGGVKLIGFLSEVFSKKMVSETEIVNFVLASYNAGHGSIENSMKITENAGLQPEIWENVRSATILFRATKQPAGMKLPGKETMHFVDNVKTLYNHYKHFFEGNF